MANDLEINLLKLRRIAAAFGQGATRVPAFVRKVLTKRMPQAVNRLKLHLSGETVKVRTGTYRRAIGYALDETPTAITARLGPIKSETPLPYPPVLEFGATIRPKKAKHLYIPIADNLTGAGVARFSPREAYDRGAVMITSKQGNLVVIDPKADTLLFVLKDEVTIAARHPIGRTVDEFRPLIIDDLQTGMLDALVGEGP
jgi:hypothetical protein